jgi:hypothetical protein
LGTSLWTQLEERVRHHLKKTNDSWKDDKVVQYVEMERQGADFTLGEKEYLTPSDDVIIIERY